MRRPYTIHRIGGSIVDHIDHVGGTWVECKHGLRWPEGADFPEACEPCVMEWHELITNA